MAFRRRFLIPAVVALSLTNLHLIAEPPADNSKQIAQSLAMQDAMLAAVYPGMSLHDAYDAAMQAASPWADGDPSFLFQFHGIGLETHEHQGAAGVTRVFHSDALTTPRARSKRSTKWCIDIVGPLTRAGSMVPPRFPAS